MIPRHLKDTLIKRLGQTPAVALLGSRQVRETETGTCLTKSPAMNPEMTGAVQPSNLRKVKATRTPSFSRPRG
jgi:hypothetical protein